METSDLLQLILSLLGSNVLTFHCTKKHYTKINQKAKEIENTSQNTSEGDLEDRSVKQKVEYQASEAPASGANIAGRDIHDNSKKKA